MPVITLETVIDAPIERCFQLSLSVDLHKLSASQTNEKAVAGVTSGLMGLGDTVTWEAKHFGIVMRMTSAITAYHSPDYFVSEMTKGTFKKLHHQHLFSVNVSGKTLMKDIFEVEAPLGILGTIAEKVFLVNYMRKFLQTRNDCIKRVAESEEWRMLIPQ